MAVYCLFKTFYLGKMPRCLGKTGLNKRCRIKVGDDCGGYCHHHKSQSTQGEKETKAVAVFEPFECAVCYGTVESKSKHYTIKVCGHKFCRECIKTWVCKGNRTCPMCRSTIGHDQMIRLNPTPWLHYPIPNMDVYGRFEYNTYLQLLMGMTRNA